MRQGRQRTSPQNNRKDGNKETNKTIDNQHASVSNLSQQMIVNDQDIL